MISSCVVRVQTHVFYLHGGHRVSSDVQDGIVGHALERTGVGVLEVLAVVLRVEVIHSDTWL